MAAAGIFELRDAADDLGSAGLAPLLVATAVAFVSGWAAIAWFLRFLRTRSLIGFAIYRVVLGVILVALLVAGTIAD